MFPEKWYFKNVHFGILMHVWSWNIYCRLLRRKHEQLFDRIINFTLFGRVEVLNLCVRKCALIFNSMSLQWVFHYYSAKWVLYTIKKPVIRLLETLNVLTFFRTHKMAWYKCQKKIVKRKFGKNWRQKIQQLAFLL